MRYRKWDRYTLYRELQVSQDYLDGCHECVEESYEGRECETLIECYYRCYDVCRDKSL